MVNPRDIAGERRKKERKKEKPEANVNMLFLTKTERAGRYLN